MIKRVFVQFIFCLFREKSIKKDGLLPVFGLLVWWAIEELNF